MSPMKYEELINYFRGDSWNDKEIIVHGVVESPRNDRAIPYSCAKTFLLILLSTADLSMIGPLGGLHHDSLRKRHVVTALRHYP